MAVEVVDDIMAMPRRHFTSPVAQSVERRPDPFWTLTVSHPNTREEIEGESELAGKTMAWEMVFSDPGNDGEDGWEGFKSQRW